VALDVLPERDAIALLRRLIGERADREPDAVRTLARCCGYLPLALRVAAEHAAARPVATLSQLVLELHDDPSGGLDALGTAEDVRADLRGVFSWSLRRLPPPAARAFHLLGLVPGNDVDVHGIAALSGVNLSEAEQCAGILVRAHLIQSDGHGRFSMHDLLRAYAREAVEQAEPADERRAATTRLFDYYLAAAAAAVDLQFPHGQPARRRNRPSPLMPTPERGFDGARAATEWLSSEHGNLVRACVHATRHGWPGHAVALALVLGPHFHNGHCHDGLSVYQEALAAAQALGAACDPVDVAYLHICLSLMNRSVGRVSEAAAHAARALEDCTRWDCPEGASMSLIVLSNAARFAGRHQEAIAHLRQALDAARSSGNRTLEASQLANLGIVHLDMEEFEEAADFLGQARQRNEELGHRLGMADCAPALAVAYAALGRYDEALAVAEHALVVEVERGRLRGQANLMTAVGDVYRRQGRLSDALEQLAEALAMCRQLDGTSLTALVLNRLGETHLAAGDPDKAADCHRQAMELTDRAGFRSEGARALTGLGDARHAAGDTAGAHRCWQQAYHSYVEMRLPAADRVKSRLEGQRWI
jgi:tetratricopeptide (TPR) repeat protein